MNYMLLKSLAIFNGLIKNLTLKISGGRAVAPLPPAMYALASVIEIALYASLKFKAKEGRFRVT